MYVVCAVIVVVLLCPAGLSSLYLAAMDAVDAVKPGAAVFVLQGAVQEAPPGNLPMSGEWSHGFATAPGLLAAGASGAPPRLNLDS